MKRMFWILVLFLMASALMPALAEASPEGKLTVMIYMVGSNLEKDYGMASKDLSKMTQSQFNSDEINVVILCGGSDYWHNGQPADQTCIYQVGYQRIRKLWSAPAINMGDADTLSFFINYTVERFPAAKYGLILWGHGGGPENGVGYDSLFNGDALTLSELGTALDCSPFSEDRLAWIVFDASLMGNLEVGMACAPFADYMIADELDMPIDGLDYGFLQSLHADMDGEAVGRAVIASYLASRPDSCPDIVASCVDLSALDAVCRAKDEMLFAATAVLGSEADSIQAVFRPSNLVDSDSMYRRLYLYDLALLAGQCAQYAPEEAAALMSTLDQAIVYSEGTVEKARGLSTFWAP